MRVCDFVLGVMFFAVGVQAKLVVDRMFSSYMVLQQEMAVPIWGTAAPGGEVTVSFRDQSVATQANTDGKWSLKLAALKLGAPATLAVSGDGDTLSFEDVLVGEVWIGSGQSNMAGRAGGYAKNDPTLAMIATSGPYPQIRLYSGSWKVADAKTIPAFSALHVSFGHALHDELKVPVGLIVGAVGGTPSGRWLSQEMAAASPALNAQLKAKMGIEADEIAAAHVAAKATYSDVVRKAKADGKKAPRFPGPNLLGDLYAKHIEYIVPYGIRGVLWDQGESKTQIAGVDQYTTMSALIAGWRGVWSQGDFPFLHVQKPSGGSSAWNPKNWVNRGARAFNATLPRAHGPAPSALKYQLDHIRMGTIKNAPLVQANDLGTGIHPQNKSGYGKRASRVALGAVYGKDVVILGPTYKSHAIEDSHIRVSFDNVGSGLGFRHAEELRGFEVAGEDGKWAWASAEIDGDSIIVSSADVPKPVHVQYAFNKDQSHANLFNKDGLPALLFTSVE
ncbi:MAG: sialate O-acetylesterase [Rhodothermales bacterium]|jgi:sialate O-acetylesterase